MEMLHGQVYRGLLEQEPFQGLLQQVQRLLNVLLMAPERVLFYTGGTWYLTTATSIPHSRGKPLTSLNVNLEILNCDLQ